MKTNFIQTTVGVRLQTEEYTAPAEDRDAAALFIHESFQSKEIANIFFTHTSVEISSVFAALMSFHDEVMTVSSEESGYDPDPPNLANYLEDMDDGEAKHTSFCGLSSFNIWVWRNVRLPAIDGLVTVVRINAHTNGPSGPNEYLILR